MPANEYLIDSERGTETIVDTTPFGAAGQFAADAAGFDGDDVCFDPFSFTVRKVDGPQHQPGPEESFYAEVKAVTGSGTGRVNVWSDAEPTPIQFDEDGFEISPDDTEDYVE